MVDRQRDVAAHPCHKPGRCFLSVSPLRTPGVSPGVKALVARELEGARTLKQDKLIFLKCHGRKPVGIYCMRAAVPRLKTVGGGRIVNISSGAAHTGGIIGAHYAASKVVIFFVRPDVVSGLFTLANFDEVEPSGVFSPCAAGCGSIV